MGVMVDEINKIVYVLPHKCGQFTISTFLMNIYGKNVDSGYHVNTLRDMGYTDLKIEHKNYYKVLILRDPYQRFISGFLQDCCENLKHYYKNIDISFLKYCRFLLAIHQIPNVNYYLKNGKKYYIDHYFTTDTPLKTKLRWHQSTMIKELKTYIEFYEYKFDKVTIIDELDELIDDIKKKFNINVKTVIGNKKNYQNDNINIIDKSVSDIANGDPYPSYDKFYNFEIQNIVEKIYVEDFELLKHFNMNNKIKKPITRAT